MKSIKIKAERPESLLKTGTSFKDSQGVEWTIVLSAGDGTAAVESEEEAGEYSNGFVYVCEEGDTYGANGVPDYIVKNASWYKNDSLEVKEEKFVLKKRAVFRKRKP